MQIKRQYQRMSNKRANNRYPSRHYQRPQLIGRAPSNSLPLAGFHPPRHRHPLPGVDAECFGSGGGRPEPVGREVSGVAEVAAGQNPRQHLRGRKGGLRAAHRRAGAPEQKPAGGAVLPAGGSAEVVRGQEKAVRAVDLCRSRGLGSYYEALPFINKMKQGQRVRTIHQLDCIYMGYLNSSYQKEGFGIQQTFKFDTYIGMWHNNKAEGKGLVVLASGTVIYANFVRDQMEGIAIVDDGSILRCGIFRNGEISGVGFEYHYQVKTWKMCRFHKGIAIEVIKEEMSDLINAPPKMINIEQSLFFHLYSYLKKDYFSVPQPYLHEDQELFLCLQSSSNEAMGPGVKVKGFKVVEAGFYMNGQLHGFGIKDCPDTGVYEIGCYRKGLRNSEFISIKNGVNYYQEFENGALIRTMSSQEPPNMTALQKKYNFNCKDFFSAKNTLPFHKLAAQAIGPLQSLPVKSNRLTPKTQPALSTPHNKLRSTQKVEYINEQKEKSTLQLMREKMKHYSKLVGSRRGVEEKESAGLQDGEIAHEENPFSWRG